MLLNTHGVSAEIDMVMSETLAQALLLLSVAVLALFVRRPNRWLILILGILCGLQVLARPAAVFSGVLVVMAAVWGFWHMGRMVLPPLAVSVLLVVLGAFGPAIYTWTETGVYSSSPMKAWSAIAFAMQVADADDLDRMPDAESREFLERALARKAELDPQVIRDRLPEEVRGWEFLNLNLYQVCLSVSAEMGMNKLPVRNPLFAKVSGPILKAHLKERISLFWDSLNTALGLTRVRLFKQSFVWVLAMAAVGLIWCSGRARLFVAACLLAHLGHLVVISWFDMPLTRYIYASEPIAWIGLLVVGAELATRLLRPRDELQPLAA